VRESNFGVVTGRKGRELIAIERKVAGALPADLGLRVLPLTEKGPITGRG